MDREIWPIPAAMSAVLLHRREQLAGDKTRLIAHQV